MAKIFRANSGGKSVAKIGDCELPKAFDLAGLSGKTLIGSVAEIVSFMPRQQVNSVTI